MSTITITIGLNSNRTLQQLPLVLCARFRNAVDDLLFAAGATVFVEDAYSLGEWTDSATGRVVREESRTWVAAVKVDTLPAITAQLNRLCERYEQDAIALTVGTTELVGQRQFATAREG